MRHSLTLLIVLLGLSGAGCGYSQCPLSDAKTTILDRDLIGTWEFEKNTQERDRVHIGLKEGSSTELEIVTVGVHRERVRITRSELRPTRIGNDMYLSVPIEGEADDEGKQEKQRVWMPMRYRSGEERLHLEVLHPKLTSDAIEAGDVDRTVEEIDIHALVDQGLNPLLGIN